MGLKINKGNKIIIIGGFFLTPPPHHRALPCGIREVWSGYLFAELRSQLGILGCWGWAPADGPIGEAASKGNTARSINDKGLGWKGALVAGKGRWFDAKSDAFLCDFTRIELGKRYPSGTRCQEQRGRGHRWVALSAGPRVTGSLVSPRGVTKGCHQGDLARCPRKAALAGGQKRAPKGAERKVDNSQRLLNCSF